MIPLFSNNGRDESAAGSPHFSLAYEHGVQPTGSSPQPDHPPRNPLAIELTVEAPGLQALASPRRPLNLGLAIDRSGSMTGGKLVAAIEAARCLVEQLPDGSRLAVVAFDDQVRDVCASTRLDDLARAEIRRRVGELEPGRTTALFDGFLRAAELVAWADSAEATDSWVILLSDGQGNQGLLDPALMKAHAAELAARGIRTITIGVGADYQAQQLTALSTGGDGAFHHASEPGEISEIVLGELKALGTATVNRLSLSLEVSGMAEWTLLGGHAEQSGTRGTVRFDRIGAGQSVRVVVLGRPIRGTPTVQVRATWLDEQLRPGSASLKSMAEQAPVERDVELAGRAARLWHAHIAARALEFNERREYESAVAFVRGTRRAFRAYTEGLAGMDELNNDLRRLEDRVGRRWGTLGHREAYVVAEKRLQGKSDFRAFAPSTLREAMDRDGKNE